MGHMRRGDVSTTPLSQQDLTAFSAGVETGKRPRRRRTVAEDGSRVRGRRVRSRGTTPSIRAPDVL